MLDATLRPRLAQPLDRLAAPLAARGVAAEHLTALGAFIGLGSAAAIGNGLGIVALVLWWANRLLDGLDGAVARRVGPTDRGGFLDIVADFTVYAAFAAGVAWARPDARMAVVLLLCAYYVSGASFLAWSSLAERRARAAPDERSLHFVGGLAEGTETIVVYSVVCLWPAGSRVALGAFAAVVAVTAVQRMVFAWRTLGPRPE